MALGSILYLPCRDPRTNDEWWTSAQLRGHQEGAFGTYRDDYFFFGGEQNNKDVVHASRSVR